MNKVDIKAAILDIETLQGLHEDRARYKSLYGGLAIALLQSELDRPEPEPVMSIDIWNDETSGYPQYDLSIQNEALRSLGEGAHKLYKDAP